MPDDFKKFGKYGRWSYGMRKAASGWVDDHARRLVNDAFQQVSTMFYHPKTHVRVVVHDDFTFAATELGLGTDATEDV